MNTIFKNKILNTIISNLENYNLVKYNIETDPSNYVTSDNKTILSADNLVLAANDSELNLNDSYYVTNYNAEQIDNILEIINNY